MKPRLLTCLVSILAVAAPLATAALPDNMALFGGSVYEYVPTYTTWDQAKATAASMSYLGFPGRLATITSAGEQAAILGIVNPNALVMLGASDAAHEGTWVWQTGPEAGTVFWKDGKPVNGAFTGWRPGEPNAFYPDEDYLVLYKAGWNDSAANSFLHGGFVVEYRLGNEGFDFGMNAGHLGAIRNLAPQARLVQLDITLAGDTFFDSAGTTPGLEFADWSLVSASPGATWTRPNGLASDGLQRWSIGLGLDPLQEIHFQVDLDRFSNPDGPGLPEGTLVTAHFTLGDITYEVSGTVHQRSVSIQGSSFDYSVRAMNMSPIPEISTLTLFTLGLLFLGVSRWVPGNGRPPRPDGRPDGPAIPASAAFVQAESGSREAAVSPTQATVDVEFPRREHLSG